MHIVLSIHREMRMDLNLKTLVSLEYCIGFVDFRCTNSRTSYHAVCTTGCYRQKVAFTVDCEVDAKVTPD